MDWVEGIGLFAGFLGVSGWYPQVKRVWIEGKAITSSDDRDEFMENGNLQSSLEPP